MNYLALTPLFKVIVFLVSTTPSGLVGLYMFPGHSAQVCGGATLLVSAHCISRHPKEDNLHVLAHCYYFFPIKHPLERSTTSDLLLHTDLQ